LKLTSQRTLCPLGKPAHLHPDAPSPNVRAYGAKTDKNESNSVFSSKNVTSQSLIPYLCPTKKLKLKKTTNHGNEYS
jgi:hypothetical protein